MKVLKKMTAIVCTVALLASVMVGCGKTDTKSAAATTDPQQPAKPVDVRLILPYSDETPADEPILPALNKLCNANFKIEWTPMISYGDKFNVIMASNDLPDALDVEDLKGSTYTNGANSGMFWELTQYLTQGNFKNLNPIAVTNSSFDGKNFVIPRERAIKRKIVCYRADWAKAAGVSTPDTIDGIYKMAKAFGTGDFDGNGKNDTIGLLLGTVVDEIDCFDELVVANGGPNRWGIKDGKVVPNFMTDEYMNTMRWLKKMCDEKLISKDFAITKTTQQVTDFIDKEKSGLWLSYGIPGTADPLLKQKQQADAKITRGDVFGYTYLKGTNGKPRVPAEDGFKGGFAFPKQTVKNEARLKELVSVFDKLNSKEGQILLNHGIQDQHFSFVKDQYIKSIDATKNKKELGSYAQLGMSGNQLYTTYDDEIGIKLAKDRITFNKEDLIANAITPLSSTTYTNSKTTLEKVINEAQFKYILGQISEDQLKQAFETWKKSGGDKVIEEYTAAYNKANKK